MSKTDDTFPAQAVLAAWQEGYNDFDESNEFPIPPYEDGSLEAESWLDGWEDRKEDIEKKSVLGAESVIDAGEINNGDIEQNNA